MDTGHKLGLMLLYVRDGWVRRVAAPHGRSNIFQSGN